VTRPGRIAHHRHRAGRPARTGAAPPALSLFGDGAGGSL